MHPQEIRNCVFRGDFRDLLKELAADKNFLQVVKPADNEQRSAVYEECVLRFFAFTERYKLFEHSVVDFLNDYMIERSKNPLSPQLITSFKNTMKWLAKELPDGIVRGNRTITPLNLFEAVAVGTGLALGKKSKLPSGRLEKKMNSTELKKLTTGATNSRIMVTGRIEFVRDALLAE